MALRALPTLYSTGTYAFLAPYDTLNVGTKLLTCVAIRGFEELIAENVNILATFYTPYGLAASDVVTATQQQVVIITFEDQNGKIYDVPSSHFGALAGIDYVPYSHVVLSVSLTSLPDSLDLTNLCEQVAELTSSTIGVTPTVLINRAPTLSGEAVTASVYQSAEIARNAAVTNRDTVYAQNLKLRTQIAALLDKVTFYEEYLDSLNLTP